MIDLDFFKLFFVCKKRYIWWKKSVDVWTKDHPFPIDIDYMITDMLELLRPKMRFSCSLEEATKQVADLEREVLVKLGMSDTPAASEDECDTRLSCGLHLVKVCEGCWCHRWFHWAS